MKQSFEPDFTPGPHALVYKTKKNYNNNVPVLLSEDKQTIISYPHPSDLKTAGKLAIPTQLKYDYLLDNRGIGKNVAFLKLTYEEYANMDSAPNLEELYELIIDKDPLTELCDCGNRSKFSDVVMELNNVIDGGILRDKCKVIK